MATCGSDAGLGFGAAGGDGLGQGGVIAFVLGGVATARSRSGPGLNSRCDSSGARARAAFPAAMLCSLPMAISYPYAA